MGPSELHARNVEWPIHGDHCIGFWFAARFGSSKRGPIEFELVVGPNTSGLTH